MVHNEFVPFYTPQFLNVLIIWCMDGLFVFDVHKLNGVGWNFLIIPYTSILLGHVRSHKQTTVLWTLKMMNHYNVLKLFRNVLQIIAIFNCALSHITKSLFSGMLLSPHFRYITLLCVFIPKCFVVHAEFCDRNTRFFASLLPRE